MPVYGVEKYIDNCISSLVGQTYKDIEIVLVDDGSKDNCPAICDEWAKKDNRIIVIHKINEGQGVARNSALDIVSGEYVLFVDGDDCILPYATEKLICATENGRHDVVLCGYTVNNGLRLKNISWYFNDFSCNNIELIYKYIAEKKIITGPVCKLFRRSIFDTIRFPAFRANEDAYIMHLLLGKCKSAYFLSSYLYIQNLRADSTELKGFDENKMHLLDCAVALRDYIEKNYTEYFHFVKDKVGKDCMVLLNKLYIEGKEKQFSACEKRLKKIISGEIENLDKKSETYREAFAYLHDIGRYKKMIVKKKIKFFVKNRLKRLLIGLKGARG